MGRKRKIKDLDGQMTMSLDQPCHLPCESGEVKCRGLQTQDSQKPMEGKHELGDTGNLMEKVADANNLYAAWKRVRANKGSGGIDGQTVEEFERKALSQILEMRKQLLAEEYKPVAVRGVQIPKPNGGMRQLGIPTVKDRIVQQAAAQVLSPLYERVFSDSSFGFRPNRSAHQALKQGSAYVEEGYATVGHSTRQLGAACSDFSRRLAASIRTTSRVNANGSPAHRRSRSPSSPSVAVPA